MQLVKLTSSQMRLGVAMPFDVRDENGNLLLAQGQTITNPSQLQTMLSRGAYAEQEAVKVAAMIANKAAPRPAAEEAAQRSKLTLFDMWEQAIWRLERLLRGIASEPDFPGRTDEFAAQFIALVNRDPDIAIYLSMRQDERRVSLYGLTHSLHTALVCSLMSRRVGWPEERQLSLIKAALTMNVSTFELQGRLAASGSKATEGHKEQLRAHPEQGCEMLRVSGVTDEEWLNAVLNHHERVDGSGYPRGVTEIPEAAVALRLADVFMAKITSRSDRPAMAVQDAARQMFQASQGSPFAAAIIKEYGVYPPGNFVQLASGETAIVIRRGATAHTPLVAAITDRSGIPIVGINRRDTSHAGFAISAPTRDKKIALAVAPEKLFGIATS